jgi:hypothetical protein
MDFIVHPKLQIQKLTIGRELAPLVVIDNPVAGAEALVEMAAGKQFGEVSSYYPGVRAKVPLSYQRFITEQLGRVLAEYFGLTAGSVRFTSCHFSLVTTPPERLTFLQRIPHIDSLLCNELAFIHYLFHSRLGGTAFYRHRATGYEYVNEERQAEYWRHLDQERTGPNSPPAAYINSDTPHYEQVGRQEGVFNRMLVYRRTSLHSGAISRDFVVDTNPRTGRLSINGFLA